MLKNLSWRKWAIIVVSIVWAGIQLYWAGFGFPGMILNRPVHLAFAMFLVYLTHPLLRSTQDIKTSKSNKVYKMGKIFLTWIPLVFIGISAAYYIFGYERLLTRWAMFDPVTIFDKIVGVSVIILLLEAGRRSIGAFLPIFAGAFLLYGVLGPYLPGILSHQGLSITTTIELQTMTDFGIYGVPLGVAVTFVYYFVIFSSFYNSVGGDRLLTDVALSTAGRTWGGAAKAAIVGSSLVGSISGSAAANVVTTGTLTIPLMKKARFSPEVAAAIEATASTGGQIMPPIMGATSFLMAYLLGKPYWEVAVAAFIPAILYYVSLFVTVHIYSVRHKIRPLGADELPDARKTIRQYWHLGIPVLVLVIQIARLVTLTMAAFRALLLLFAISFLRKPTRMSLSGFLRAVEAGARSAAVVSVACGLAGIVIGVIDYSGLGQKLTGSLIGFLQVNLILGLLMMAGIVLLLGMGMPTVGAYLSAAVLLAPALERIGFPTLCIHLFILYYAVISMVTPPIAISAYVAAGIAGAKINKTGLIAFLFSLPGFIIPFLFLYFPSLVYHNSLLEISKVLLPFFAIVLVLIYFAPRFFSLKEREASAPETR